MANPITSNISSLSTPNLIGAAKTQLNGKVTSVKQPIVSEVDKLKNRLNELNDKVKKTKEEYGDKTKKLQSDFQSGYIDENELNQKYQQFQNQLEEELKVLNEGIQQIEGQITSVTNDILKQAKSAKKKINNSINNNIKNAKKSQVKANVSRNIKVLKNLQKSLGPIIISQLTNILVKVVDKNAQLQELVDKTNEIIDSADTIAKINQARVARNSALNILNTQENRLTRIRNVVQTIQRIVDILTIIVNVIQLILRLGSPVPIPLPIKIKLQPILQRILKLLSELGIALSIVNSILSNLISDIEYFKSQLRQIGTLIDIKTTNPLSLITLDQLGEFLGEINPGNSTNFDTYKGFKFAIKEDNDPKFVVRGYKRHYAVAIDTNNVEVLKSDLSFTLDPQDLIDTLKTIIDRENLIA